MNKGMPQTWIYGKVEHDNGSTTYRLRYDEIPGIKNYITKFESLCKKQLVTETAVCVQLSVITLDGGSPLINWHGDEIPANIIFNSEQKRKYTPVRSIPEAVDGAETTLRSVLEPVDTTETDGLKFLSVSV